MNPKVQYIDHAITYLVVVVLLVALLRLLLYRVLFAASFTSGRVWYRIRLAIRKASGHFQYHLLLDAKMVHIRYFFLDEIYVYTTLRGTLRIHSEEIGTIAVLQNRS